MKKFLTVMSFLALILSTSAASADYPKYLDKNKAYVLCGMHAGTGWYINRRSIDVKRFDPPYFRLEVEVAVVPRAGEGDLSNVKYIRNEYLYDWSTRKMYRIENGQKKFLPPVGDIATLGSSYDGELAFFIKYRKRFYGELYADKNSAFNRDLYGYVENAEYEEARIRHEGLSH